MTAPVLIDDLDVMERDDLVLDAAVAYTPWEARMAALDPATADDELSRLLGAEGG